MKGLILSTEVTRKRVKSVNKFMKLGKQETMMVIRVDKEKRYIDLSKKKSLARGSHRGRPGLQKVKNS